MKPLEPFDVGLAGIQLIEASAGTGKTYTITTIFLRALLERRLRVEQIAVVTFTKAATAELRDRIRARVEQAARAFARTLDGVPPEKATDDAVVRELIIRERDAKSAHSHLVEALRSIDQAAIFTIHGFAQRLLQEHAFESGALFDVELMADQRSLVLEVAHDFWSSRIATLPPGLWALCAERKTNLSSVAALCVVAAAFRDVPVVPRQQSPEAMQAGPLEQLERVQKTWARVRDEYRTSKDEALALLGPVVLYKTQYDFPKLALYREELESFFATPPELGAIPPAGLKWLSAASIADKTKKGHVTPRHSLFDSFEQLSAEFSVMQVTADDWMAQLRAQIVAFARDRIAVEHHRAQTMSFDDLLYDLRDAIRVRSRRGESQLAVRVRQRYPLALIDEFQDTDPVQYEIFRTIYGGSGDHGLFLIGDPKQAIYSFRGADVFAYLEAARDASDHAWTLTTNYRSDPSVLEGLNHLFGRLERPFLVDGIRYTPVSAPEGRKDRLISRGAKLAPIEIHYLSRERAGRSTGRWTGEAEWCSVAAQDIARLLAQGHEIEGRRVEPGDIAVLTRTNAQAQEVQAHLRDLRIPCVLQGDRSVFEAGEAEEVRRILRGVAEPSSASAVRTALSTRLLGVDAEELAGLADDESGWEAWVERFRLVRDHWENRGIAHAFERLLDDLSLVPATLRLTDGERRMTNFRHLIELLHQAEAEEHLGIPGLLQWFDEARFDPVRQGMAPEVQQLRLESDARAVTLTTIHKSKGLEYPIVYLPTVGGALFSLSNDREYLRYHDQNAGGRMTLDVRLKDQKPEPLRQFEDEQRAEVMRLLYVAATRAKHHLVMSWGGVSAAFSSLGYLLHHQDGLGSLETDLEGRLKNASDEMRLGELAAIEASSRGTVAVRQVGLEPADPYEAPGDATPTELRARQLTRRTPPGARTSSFSALIRDADSSHLSTDARAGRDIDEHERASERESRGVAEATALDVGADECTLAHFPRGARPGDLIHSIFERADFAEATAEQRLPLIGTELLRHGYDVSWQEQLGRAIEESLETSLNEERTLRLGALERRQRAAEMEFTFPVADEKRPLTVKRLVAALENSDDPIAREYARHVKGLQFPALSGYLRGFIDLVFEHEGRFFVADYKSNHLGNRYGDYGPEALRSAMVEHHYVLQYLIYSVAVDGYLSWRLPGYDFDRHFGGVYYLFTRGMKPGSSTGVYFHRPARRLIESLGNVLGTARGKAA